VEELVTMELNRDIIHERLRALSRRDRKRQVFGAAAHEYKLNPPLDVEEIESFEAKHGIILPKDYNLFITEIGNGGAGPYYGLFPFGHDDDGAWKEGRLIGDVGKPFPHSEAWNLDEEFWKREPDPPEDISEEEEDRLWEEWDKVLEPSYWNPAIMNGAIPICHLGCAQRQWLVVNGEQKGFVWNDLRVDQAGIAPVRDASGRQMTFTDWCLAWLDEAERGGKKHTVDTVSYKMRQPGERRRELLTLFLLIVAGVLLGLLLALSRR
jgi:hypothetical protein